MKKFNMNHHDNQYISAKMLHYEWYLMLLQFKNLYMPENTNNSNIKDEYKSRSEFPLNCYDYKFKYSTFHNVPANGISLICE